MDLSMLAAPIIGSVIGYATNYIAVKMLFRPMNPVTIGKFTLPFTPGIIPKGKPRLAHAVGNVIGTSLLSKDTLQETLLSDEMKEKVSQSVHQFLVRLEADERTVQTVITDYIPEENFEVSKANAIDYIGKRVEHQLQEKPVGEFIAGEVIRTVKENLKGGFLGLMASDSLLNPIGVKIQEGIDAYLSENALNLVVPAIIDECDKLLEKPLSSCGEILASHEEGVTKAVLQIYEDLIENRMDKLFHSLNIPGIVENKINAMDNRELETLILSVMKKELKAIVNLGALIGFVLGLVNLLF